MLSDLESLPSIQLGEFILRFELDELTPTGQETAERELRENPENREIGIKKLRELLQEGETKTTTLTWFICVKSTLDSYFPVREVHRRNTRSNLSVLQLSAQPCRRAKALQVKHDNRQPVAQHFRSFFHDKCISSNSVPPTQLVFLACTHLASVPAHLHCAIIKYPIENSSSNREMLRATKSFSKTFAITFDVRDWSTM